MMRLVFLGMILATYGLSTVTDSRAQTPALPAPGTKESAELERETFALINHYRKENELPVLGWDPDIAKVARGHSRDMATGEVGFGHEGFGERMNKLKKALFGMRGGGENVFMTDNPEEVARTAVALWLKSPPHLKNIRGDYNYSGMGIWRNGQGVIYFTQIFVKLQPATPPPSDGQVLLPPYGFVPRPTNTVP
jgi:uncharacterized protein YkwD